MSKKLIAVAAAAALALTGLVGIAPANASVVATFGVSDALGTGIIEFTPSASAAGAAANIVVPADNKLTFTNTTERSSLAKVTVNTSVGETVTASSTGALKILDLDGVGKIGTDFRAETTAGTDYTSTAGTQSYTKVSTTTSVVFYVFTTSTSADSLTISKSGNTRVVHIKGAVGSAYNIAAALPALIPLAAPDDNNVIVKITDVFGNTVTAETILAVSTTGSGIEIDPAVISGDLTLNHSITEGGHGFKLNKTAAGGFAMSLALKTVPGDVSGLPKAQKSLFLTTTVADLSVQVTALTAQVAALTAQMADMRTKARSVTKKKYNTLARKWNAANPSARVALKK